MVGQAGTPLLHQEGSHVVEAAHLIGQQAIKGRRVSFHP